MSKASRMFRSRSNRGANLAIRPVAELDAPKFPEADLSACLAALYNSSTDEFPHDFSAGVVPDAPSPRQRESVPDVHALLTFTPKSTAQPSEPDEVLAVLLQTIDSAEHAEDCSSAEIIAATFSDDSAIINASSPDSRRTELFIVEKPLAPIRPPRHFSPKSWTWRKSPLPPETPLAPPRPILLRSLRANFPTRPKLSKNKPSRK